MLHMNKEYSDYGAIYYSLQAIVRAKTKYTLGNAESWVLAQVLYGSCYTYVGYEKIKWLVNELVTAKWNELRDEK